MRLRMKVTLAFLLFIAAPFLIVGWISADRAAESMKDEVARTFLQLVKQNHLTIEKSMAAVNDKTITFLDSHVFNHEGVAFWTGIDTLGEIKRADTILESWSSDGTAYALYMNNASGNTPPIDLTGKDKGFAYLGSDREGRPDWAEDAISAGGSGVFRRIETKNGSDHIGFMRSILNPQRYEESLGVLLVGNIELKLMGDLISVQMPEGSGVFLLNDRDDILMQVGNEELRVIPDRLRLEGDGYEFVRHAGQSWLYAFSHRPSFDTKLVYQIPLESIMQDQAGFQWLLMTVSMIYLALVLLFFLFLLRLIVKPLLRLVSIMKIYEPGKEIKLEVGRPRTDEFGILYGAFRKMVQRLDQSIQENYVMKIRQKENELATLHSQITPHLLYNTLDSIYWYAVDSGNTNVGDMVKDLSRLLRIGLSKGKTTITIREELEHVQAYCRLQMMRYPDTFTVQWEIEEGVEQYALPKVILQPLVENAIFHAVSGMDGEGEIRIRIRSEGDSLALTVEDNGFIPADLERMERIVRGEVTDQGYGIRNVHQRIQLHFGEEYGLRYERREGGGLRAIIRFPKRKP